jgi:putative ABC transport system ATP-binding protein
MGEVDVVALRGATLDLMQGELLVLLGASGSGKSTLLNILGGLDVATEGELWFRDEDLSRASESRLTRYRRDHVGFVFQFYNLIPVLTAFENVALPLQLTKMSEAEKKERVTQALSMVNLADRMDHTPNELSGGQQQRVAIARALITDPDLIVADEPTGDLDRQSAEDILNMLQRLNQETKKTILMVTHDPKAAEHARAVVHLEKGQLETKP